MGILVDDYEETKTEEKVPETDDQDDDDEGGAVMKWEDFEFGQDNDAEEDTDAKPDAMIAPEPPEPIDEEQPAVPSPPLPERAPTRATPENNRGIYASNDPFPAPNVPQRQVSRAASRRNQNNLYNGSKDPFPAPSIPKSAGGDLPPDVDPSDPTKKREINPDFKDLRETGAWGEVSKKEKLIALGVLLLILVGVVVAVVVLVTNNDGSGDPKIQEVPAPPRPTKAPTMSPTTVPEFQQLNIVLEAVENHTIMGEYAMDLPLEFFDFEFPASNASSLERALSWLLFQDERDRSGEFVTRTALASIYFHWENATWDESWLEPTNACDWQGIACDTAGEVQEIDLSSKGLEGPLPDALSLLPSLGSLILSNNAITGELDPDLFRELPNLSILYLDSNNLSGEVPKNLRDNEVLSKFLGAHLESRCNETTPI